MNDERRELLPGLELRSGPEFRFTSPDTLMFLTGVPLSGKSSIAPLLSASIEGCVQQSMDVMRLIAQQLESDKPASEKSLFLQYGSCDSYVFVGDGSYSPKSLIEGFNLYAEAVCSTLAVIEPKLEVQGVRNLLFEGVQLTPDIVRPYLIGNNRLIIVTANEERLRKNIDKLYWNEPQLKQRYAIEKLLLLQEEILNQSRTLNSKQVIYADNSGEVSSSTLCIMSQLLNEDVIRVQ